jgi:hypothetical protein
MKAVYIGKDGEVYGDIYQMPGIWPDYLYYAKDGTLMSPYDEEGNFTNPVDSPDYSHKAVITVTPGEVVDLPDFDPELMRRVYESGKFAKAGFEGQVNEWHKAGVNGQTIFKRLLALGAVLQPGPGPELKPEEKPGESPAPDQAPATDSFTVPGQPEAPKKAKRGG